MCGLFFSTQEPGNVDFSDLAARGPDYQNSVTNSLGYFYHSNLSTRLQQSQQPISTHYGCLLYNGTQFEFKHNDAEFIANNLDFSAEKNIEFVSSLLGDFAIIWVTETNILLARDFGGNKPLFYGYRGSKFCASSIKHLVLQQGFEAHAVPANQILVFSRLPTIQPIKTAPSKTFDLHQTVNNFDTVFENFERSVLLRYEDATIVPLSSGMDSGGIAACLYSNNKTPAYSSRIGHEDVEILQSRYSMLQPQHSYIFSEVSYETIKETSLLRSEWKRTQNVQVAWQMGKYAKSINRRCLLSGTGSDEIYSDYGFDGIKLRTYSLVGGKFPSDLSPIWPWCHRKELPLELCIISEDYVSGLYGIDTKNPYMDTQLIQSWLNTTQELKNKKYKYWQQEYLTSKKFPYDPEPKNKKCLPVPREVRKQIFLKNQHS